VVVPTIVQGDNSDLIEAVVALGLIRPDDVVLDPTYGEGVFWKRYQHPDHLFISHDIAIDGWDFRHPTEREHSIDVITFDTGYVAPGGRETSTIKGFHHRYGTLDAPRTPELLDEYIAQGMKALVPLLRARVKRYRYTYQGLLMVKSMDYESSGKLHPGRYHVISTALDLGLHWEDFFLLPPRGGRPQPARTRQVTARGKPSYLDVFSLGRPRTVATAAPGTWGEAKVRFEQARL
jgi:hypothetical protein